MTSLPIYSCIDTIDDKGTFATALLFSQHVIKHCPQFNLLSLVNETELTNGFTLTAILSASDAVQITLSPSTTKLSVTKIITSTPAEPEHTHFDQTTPQPPSGTLLTTDTTTTQGTEASFNTTILMVTGALLVCFITTIISCTVIIACYCQRAKTQRMITNAVEPSMFQMEDHSYSEEPCAKTGIYDRVKPKSEPLPDLPEEQYEDMKPVPFPESNMM